MRETTYWSAAWTTLGVRGANDANFQDLLRFRRACISSLRFGKGRATAFCLPYRVPRDLSIDLIPEQGG